MPVSTLVKSPNSYGVSYRIGYGDMVFSFFSTISYHLEGIGKWGSRFPRLLLDLCDHGVIENEHLDEFDKELRIIYKELQKFHLSDAIYDIGDLSKPIPWEVIPGEENNNLAQPWVTPRGGTSYFEVFQDNIRWAKRENASILLMYPKESAFPETLWERKEKGREYWIKDSSIK